MDGLDDVKRNLNAAINRMVAQAAAAGDESAHYLEAYAKSTAPFTDRSKYLRNSIKGSSEAHPDHVQVMVSANMEYAAFVELGTSRSRPYAFLWPTVASNADIVTGIFRKRLQL